MLVSVIAVRRSLFVLVADHFYKKIVKETDAIFSWFGDFFEKDEKESATEEFEKTKHRISKAKEAMTTLHDKVSTLHDTVNQSSASTKKVVESFQQGIADIKETADALKETADNMQKTSAEITATEKELKKRGAEYVTLNEKVQTTLDTFTEKEGAFKKIHEELASLKVSFETQSQTIKTLQNQIDTLNNKNQMLERENEVLLKKSTRLDDALKKRDERIRFFNQNHQKNSPLDSLDDSPSIKPNF